MPCPDPELGKIVCLCVHKCVDLIYNKEAGSSFFFLIIKLQHNNKVHGMWTHV